LPVECASRLEPVVAPTGGLYSAAAHTAVKPCDMEDELIVQLAEILQTQTSLTKLDISRNYISDVCAASIFQMSLTVNSLAHRCPAPPLCCHLPVTPRLEISPCSLAVWEGVLLPLECTTIPEPRVARRAEHAACERAPVLPPCRTAQCDQIKSAALLWPLAAAVCAPPRRRSNPLVVRPLECTSTPEHREAGTAEHSACERAPVLPPYSAALQDLTKPAALIWPLAVSVCAPPRRRSKRPVDRYLECATVPEPIIARRAEHAACERAPVLPPCRTAQCDQMKSAALLWPLAAAVCAPPRRRSKWLVIRPLEYATAVEHRVANMAGDAACEKAPVLPP
jgi:hypothetical protein